MQRRNERRKKNFVGDGGVSLRKTRLDDAETSSRCRYSFNLSRITFTSLTALWEHVRGCRDALSLNYK